jgi:hypothetical protein
VIFYSYVSPGLSYCQNGTNSAAKVLLCMRRRSTSLVLLTRKALWPEGIMWRVFLFEPKPICAVDVLVSSALNCKFIPLMFFGRNYGICRRTDGMTI